MALSLLQKFTQILRRRKSLDEPPLMREKAAEFMSHYEKRRSRIRHMVAQFLVEAEETKETHRSDIRSKVIWAGAVAALLALAVGTAAFIAVVIGLELRTDAVVVTVTGAILMPTVLLILSRAIMAARDAVACGRGHNEASASRTSTARAGRTQTMSREFLEVIQPLVEKLEEIRSICEVTPFRSSAAVVVALRDMAASLINVRPLESLGNALRVLTMPGLGRRLIAVATVCQEVSEKLEDIKRQLQILFDPRASASTELRQETADKITKITAMVGNLRNVGGVQTA